MANNNAMLVYFETEKQSFANRDKVVELGFAGQDLYATESPVEGTDDYLNNLIRDAGYEEIFHLVQSTGIQSAVPAFHEAIVTAQKAASSARTYKYSGPGKPFEYIISAIDVYYGLWAQYLSKYVSVV